MRFAGCPVIRLLLLTTLLLLPNAPAPVQAGVGMPEIGSLQIGPYRAHLLNDSAGLRRGTNTLTVHIPDLPLGDDVTLRLYGPGGELINVPLRPLRVLSGPEGGHAVATASTAALAHDSAASAGHAPEQAPEGNVGSDAHAGQRGQPAHRETPAAEAALALTLMLIVNPPTARTPPAGTPLELMRPMSRPMPAPPGRRLRPATARGPMAAPSSQALWRGGRRGFRPRAHGERS